MLELKNIVKQYEIGKKDSKDYQIVNALNGVDLCFRQNEFVSILGPSGCGKTTMLNIIGGLDKYTSGDLVIKGKSTKQFKDKDWDNYRNHSVGFVFQSYNLIHHQTILHNVELALTLSGVSKKERKIRALEALDKVGLKDRANAKPNQLSGGQMQRVAIARAIVNDPDIILADEPTGALDSKTSVQIMDILKELSKTRLVIMVTHNPDLADEYSTRIVRLKDGELVDDTNPYNPNEPIKKTKKSATKQKIDNSKDVKPERVKKPKKRMSFWTALSLSFKNLLTKKARTILVSFAGSIGIIGIALILAVSSGFSGYMDKIQEDTLSQYPIVIEEQSVNYMNIISSMFGGNEESKHDKDAVYTDDFLSSMLDSLANSYQSNDMKNFNTYLQDHYNEIEPYVTAIKYSYNMDLHIYNNDDTQFVNPISPGSNVMYDISLRYCIKYLVSVANILVESSPTNVRDFVIKSQGPEFMNKEEAFLMTLSNVEGVDINKMRTDLRSSNGYLLTEAELVRIINSKFGIDIEAYKNNQLGLFNEMIDNTKFVHSQYDLIAGDWNNDQLYIAKDDNNNDRTHADMVLVLDKNNELDEYLLYALGLIDENQISYILDGILEKDKHTIRIDYNNIVGQKFKLYLKTDTCNAEGVASPDGKPATDKEDNYIMLRISGIVRANDETSGGALDEGLVYPKALTEECILRYNTAVQNGAKLNPIDKDNPSKIAIYANSFKMKNIIEDFITDYNSSVDEEQKITYTDYMGLMMSMVGSIVDTVTYVLIAFVSVSLVVSSIMIGIITYISVLERTKEIGVLRSVGASKRDIKRVFTAESLIIGFAAGALGIIITLLLCIPINIIFKAFTGISTLASLPVMGGVTLVAISMALTFIAGLIPAQVASKKDPVIALRSE